ncbi:hypothetical protein HS088_TW05G00149 [Tripterygium wilfordii]|uniref:Uncharacterized protein n=1 Tax=Tripterygium wilfordii TaxID=458696 RepID=A0A7J7DM78_TRIWF|nr:uncharacterized protein LOC119999091 [Tripterygium wilfordii]KAF5747428.1 hypothetical protein HS088_TW05G00149 [Tripterygium wilfordii]
MADIAMLVAEEYERRVKNSSKASGAAERVVRGGGGDLEISFSASNFGQKMKKLSGQVNKMELLSWSLEPKTQIGLAASNGFFSA